MYINNRNIGFRDKKERKNGNYGVNGFGLKNKPDVEILKICAMI